MYLVNKTMLSLRIHLSQDQSLITVCPGCAMAGRCGVTSASDVRRRLLLVAVGLEAGKPIWQAPARRVYQSA
jgi:hypothetical protein